MSSNSDDDSRIVPMTVKGSIQRVTTAERMREYRRRRRIGFRCMSILLHETEINALIEKGYLLPELRHDHDALLIAINEFISHELGAPG